MLRRPLARRTPLSRKQQPRKKTGAIGSDFTADAKEVVLARSRGVCEAGTPACTFTAAHFHHVKLRSQGGKGVAGNCLHVCQRCHLYIHTHPAESYERGWLVRGVGRSES